MSVDLESGSTHWGSTATMPVSAVPFTVACWFRLESNIGMGIAGLFDTATTNNYHFLGYNNTSTSIMARSAAGGTANDAQCLTAMSLATWYHCCASFDVTTGTDRAIYLDGGSKVTATTNRAAAGLDTFAIGRVQTSAPAQPADGMIAHLAVWNVILTDGEVLHLARGTDPRMVRSESLQGYWPMRTPTETHRVDGAPNAITWNNSPGTGMNPPLIDPRYYEDYEPYAVAAAATKGVAWVPGQLGVPDPILAAM